MLVDVVVFTLVAVVIGLVQRARLQHDDETAVTSIADRKVMLINGTRHLRLVERRSGSRTPSTAGAKGTQVGGSPSQCGGLSGASTDAAARGPSSQRTPCAGRRESAQ